jgi:hypothetical protein
MCIFCVLNIETHICITKLIRWFTVKKWINVKVLPTQHKNSLFQTSVIHNIFFIYLKSDTESNLVQRSSRWKLYKSLPYLSFPSLLHEVTRNKYYEMQRWNFQHNGRLHFSNTKLRNFPITEEEWILQNINAMPIKPTLNRLIPIHFRLEYTRFTNAFFPTSHNHLPWYLLIADTHLISHPVSRSQLSWLANSIPKARRNYKRISDVPEFRFLHTVSNYFYLSLLNIHNTVKCSK